MATNTITDKNTLKSWFKRGLKPLEAHFHAWMDAYWHKSEKIPTSSIEGLEKTLNSKAESFAVESTVKELQTHRQDTAAHKTENEQAKLNNLADDPNTTYATKEELNGLPPESIVIPFDFTKNFRERRSETKAFLQEYIEDGSFFSKPVYMKCISKSSYTEGVDAKEYKYVLPVSSVEKSDRGIIYSFDYPISINDIDYPETESRYKIDIIYYLTGAYDVLLNDYVYSSDKTLFLYTKSESGIGGPFSIDDEIGIGHATWSNFHDFLDQSIHPAIYLRTLNTETYIPASYKFILNPALSVSEKVYTGSIEIIYYKFIDNKKQLWIETRNFTEALGGFKRDRGSRTNTTIQKIDLEKDNIFVVEEYPTDLSSYPDGSIFIKQGAAS